MPKGSAVTRELFQTVKQLQEICPEYKAEQIAEIVKKEATVVRVMFRMGTWEEYEAYKKDKAEKQRAREKKKAERKDPPAEEKEPEVPGQIRMDLSGAEQKYTTVQVQIPANEPLVLVNEQKMMRFQAQMTDRIVKAVGDSQVLICMKLDKLNDTLCQILRCMRKE